ncbi:MAG: L,D-transpeptidase family protein [Xanthobacteraceae bacterium]
MNRSPLARTLLASAALVAAIALAGCNSDSIDLSGRSLAPIPDKTLAEMAEKNMSKESPILIRLFKQEAELEIWKQDNSGKFALLKTFPICRWSGELGPKIKEGDRQAPEGFYTIAPTQMNPTSQYYLAFNMGFPNDFDRAHGRTGAHLMVHGDCSSRGCYAMTDEQITEIYAMARESFFGGQQAFQVQAYPFHMTPENLAKHRSNPNMPFWKMLKEGYDHFEVTRLEPKVDVCERRYVFDAYAPGDASAELKFNPRGPCPAFEVPSDVATAVAEKQQRDEIKIASLVGRGMPTAPIATGTDGGMNEVFVAALHGGRALPGRDGNVRRIPVSAPGTIPSTVNPPTQVAMYPAPQSATGPSMQIALAPAATSAVDVPLPRPAPTALGRVPTQIASAKPEAPASRNFLASLFTSDESDTAASSPSILDRAARAVGLRGSATAQASETPKAAPAEAPKPVSVAQPAPKPAPSTPAPSKPAPVAKPMPLVATAPAQPKPRPLPERAAPPTRVANAGAIRPQYEPAEKDAKSASKNAAKTTQTPSAVSASLLAGAAPVVPAGSFGTSWSALR